MSLYLNIKPPASSGGKKVSASFTLEGKPKPKWRPSDPNPFVDGLLVFHEFTENEENPINPI